jgi:transposase
MFITTVPNRNSNPTVLLRESYREDGKVRVRTLANLTHWSTEKVATLDAALRGGRITVDGEFDLLPGRAHGNVYAVLATMHRLELENILGSRPCPERGLAMALVAGRVIEPGSRLSLARAVAEETRSNTLGEELGVVNSPVESFYGAMDWLLERQDIIEKKLAKRHLADGVLILYDMTTVYLEGSACELGRYGHGKEGRNNKLQIQVGLLCTREGIPVSVQVFDGSAGETLTLQDQIKKVKEQFGLTRVVFVADRGIMRDIRIREDLAPQGLDWVTALRRPDIRDLLVRGAFQASLFDEVDAAEIEDEAYPGERLVVCRNPFQAEERARRRAELLESTDKGLKVIYLQTIRKRDPLKDDGEIGMKVGALLAKYGTGKFYELRFEQGSFSYRQKPKVVEEDANLDGIYILRTSVPRETLNTRETIRAYHSLSEVETAFRCLKTLDLQIRPIYHRLTDRVRAHAFVCMLAYYVEWHMRQALAPLMNTDEGRKDAVAKAKSPVRSTGPTERAVSKRGQKRNEAGEPVQDFRDILRSLAGLARVECRPKDPKLPSIHRTSVSAPYHRKVFELLQVTPL